MNELRLSLMGGMLSAVGPMSMYLYAPAITAAAADLSTTTASINLTLASFFGGFAVSQLFVGPISDAVGRKATINAFLGAFCLATVAAYLATSVDTLMVARFVQGVGAAVGMSVSRALVRDLHSGKSAARVFSTLTMVTAVAPAISPIVGGTATTLFGWRSVFVLMAAYGAVLILTCALFVVETVHRNWSGLRPRQWWLSYRDVLSRRAFVAPALCTGSLVGVVYANSTLLPSVLMGVVGLSPLEFGVAILTHPVGYLAGSVVARRVLARSSATTVVVHGYVLIAIGCVGMLGLLVVTPGLWQVLLPVGIYSFGLAFIMPVMTAASLEQVPHVAGAASSLLGFTQMMLGLLASILGNLLGDLVTAVALLMPIMALLSLVSFASHLSSSEAG